MQFKKVVLFLVLILIGPFLHACSCIGNATVKQARKDASLVASGRIVAAGEIEFQTDTETSIRLAKFTFVITQIYKGKISLDTITIITDLGDDQCGYGFVIGTEYLLYATDEFLVKYSYNYLNRSKKLLKGMFRTSICTRTRLLEEAKDDINELK